MAVAEALAIFSSGTSGVSEAHTHICTFTICKLEFELEPAIERSIKKILGNPKDTEILPVKTNAATALELN
jgi:hypothetical protein